ARSLLSQMDVPARGAFVMSVVTPAERPAAASFTAVPRSLAAAISPSITGAMFAAGAMVAPPVACGVLKIAYDLALFAAFRRGAACGACLEIRSSVWYLGRCMATLGTIGFRGPVPLVGYMHRALVEERRWVSEADYKEGLTLPQLMPGPLAAQLAIYLGYVHY